MSEDPVKIKLRSAFVSFVILFSMLMVSFPIQLFFIDYLGHDKQFISYFFIASLIPFLLLFNYFRKKKVIDFKDIGFIKTDLKKNIVYGITLGVFVGLLGWFLRWLLHIKTGVIPEGTEVVIFFYLFFSACISPPIWEEIAVRGLFFNAVKNITDISEKLKKSKYLQKTLIILIVSVFFLMAHIDREPKPMIVIFITSIFYTAAYYKTRNIALPIVAHFFYNLFVILQPYVFTIV